jgi:hypothetical protein
MIKTSSLMALVIVGIVLALGVNSFSSISGGFSVLSISSVDLQSNDPQLGGQAWIINVVQNGAGQYAKGTFDNSEITKSGKFAESDFQIETNMIENKAEYNIRNDFDNLFYINYFEAQPRFLQSAGDWCKEQGAYAAIKPQFSLKTFCIRKNNQGIKGTVSSGSQIFKSEVIFTKLKTNEKAVSVIDNIGQSSAKVGDIGYANWVGSLVSGQAIPQPADQDICALYSQGAWKTIDCSDFQAWRSKMDSQDIPNCVAGKDEQGMKDCINSMGYYASSIIQGKAFIATGGLQPKISGDTSNGKIIMELPKQFSYPMIVAKVKASWLGVVVPVGKPKLISVSSDEFKTGNDGFVKAIVSNVGDGIGSFDISLSCNNPFSSSDSVRLSGIQQQEQRTLYLKITASVSQPTSGTCTVTARDANQPSNIDSMAVAVKASNLAICQAGQKRTFGKYIQQCNQYGSAWITIKECEENKIADPITFECISDKSVVSDPIGGLGKILGDLGQWIIIALIIVAAIKIIPVIKK